MAKLPSVERRNPTTQLARSMVTSADVIRSEGAMARGLADAGAALGSLGAAFDAYEATVEDGYLANVATDIERADDERRRQYVDDPDGYAQASQAYLAETLKNAPSERSRSRLEKTMTRLAADGESKIRDGVWKRGLQKAENDLSVRAETATERAAGLARSGDTSSAEYQALTTEIANIHNERVRSPLSTYTQAQADRDSKRTLDTLTVEGIYGGIERGWSGTQGDPDQKYAALASQLRQSLDDPNLAFDSGERKRLEAQGLAMLKNMRAEAKANNNELRAEAASTVQMLQADSALANDPSLDDLGGRLRASGLHREALTLERVRSGAKILGPYMQAPSSEQEAVRRNAAARGADSAQPSRPVASGGRSRAAAMNRRAETAMSFFVGRGFSQAQAAGIVGNLIQESSLNTTARNPGDGADGSDSIGVAQWNGKRAAALRRFASERGRPVDDLETQLEFIVHELGGDESAAGQALRNARTVDEAAAAFIGYERPQGWSAGNPRGGHGWNNRLNHASKLAGITVPEYNGEALAGLPKGVREQFQKDATESVKTTFTAVKAGITQGILPSEDTVASMIEQFPLIADRGLIDEIQQTLQTAGVVAQATDAGRPIDEQRGDIADLRTQMMDQGADPVGMQLLEAGEKMLAANEKIARENPLEFWDRTRGVGRQDQRLGEIDWANPNGAQAELQKRAMASQFVSSLHELPPVAALRPQEVAAFEGRWRLATVEERTGMLSTLTSTLPPDVLMATLEKFAGKESTSTLAWAGAIQSKDPQIAQSIVRGSAIMEAEKNFVWSDDATAREEVSQRWPDMGVGGFEASSAMMKATRARYADLSNQAGDRSGKINAERFEQSLNDVTGGIVEYNGGRVVAPRFGMTQDEFDDRMDGLAVTDVLGAVTQKGEQIPPAVVQRHGTLVNVADGRYLIRFGEGESAWFATMKDGRPFTLDLRDME